jgi:type II secretory pathway component GspD/PulD (secretin)
MTFRGEIVSKRRSFLTRCIGCILLLGMFVSLLPIRGMEAVCRAQAIAQEQTIDRPDVKPEQQSLSPSPALSPLPPLQPQLASAQASRRGQFTLNFDDADVYTFIQTIFGEILKVNYVVDPRVKGRVTFRAIAPVPAENVLPLMEVILRLNGIGIVEDNGLYRIVPIGDISKEPSPISYGRDPETIRTTGKALLQVVPIIYVQSSEALKLITPFASHNAVLIDVPKGNQIIVVDTDANVKRMLRLIEVFDNDKLKQRRPQVFVYQVQNGKAKDIATLLQQIFAGGKGSAADAAAGPSRAGAGSPFLSTPMSASTPSGPPASVQPQVSTIPAGGETLVSDPVKIISDEITNTIVVLSTPEDYAAIAKAIEKIDIVPRQVIIEGMIASVSLTDNLSLGLARLFKQSYSGYSTGIGINAAGLGVNPAQAGFTFLATDPTGAAIALLSAMAVESKAKVLAAPHILVSDNRDAKIQVGQQVPLLTSETYGAVGVTPQRNYQYKDIGIILKVKPRINEGGLVSLEISQEISTSEKITLGGTEQLLLNKTEAATNLVVQDGQTIVIGGLIREDTSKSSSGIPFLSRIPFLGWLFGGWEDDKKRQELIILLTPRVIKNQKEARDLSGEFIDNMSEASKGRIKWEELLRERPPRIPEGAKPPEPPGYIVEQKP